MHRPPPSSSPPDAARRLLDPVQRFIHTESGSGIALAAAAIVALVWANVAGHSYDDFWHRALSITIGDWSASTTLQKFAKDGLMAIFFLVVGLEIKRELVVGELADRRVARVPLIAALGGMAVPAAIYLAFNGGGLGRDGWGIPMATDIAFAMGVLTLLSARVPGQLGAFLLAIAVVDDIGAILVIAVFYSDGVHIGNLFAAVACLALFRLMFHWRVRLVVPYALLAIAAWGFMAGSGVSPTIAGVALGLLVPARPWRDSAAALGTARGLVDDMSPTADHGEQLHMWRRMDDLGRQAVPMTERIEEVLHPWTAFVVLPVFALAWAGVPISREILTDAWSSSITVGIVVGLVVGKAVGVTAGTWLAVRLGLGDLPSGLRWAHVVGVACLAGIGFTVSVFVSSLAFADDALGDQARIGILIASVIAGLIGTAVLMLASRRDAAEAGRA